MKWDLEKTGIYYLLIKKDFCSKATFWTAACLCHVLCQFTVFLLLPNTAMPFSDFQCLSFTALKRKRSSLQFLCLEFRLLHTAFHFCFWSLLLNRDALKKKHLAVILFPVTIIILLNKCICHRVWFSIKTEHGNSWLNLSSWLNNTLMHT